MKKIALFMAVLILAVPAMAAVSLSGVGEDDGGTLKGTISYDKSVAHCREHSLWTLPLMLVSLSV